MSDSHTYFDFDKSFLVQEYLISNDEPTGSSRPPTAFEIQLQAELVGAEIEIDKLLQKNKELQKRVTSLLYLI